MADSKSSSDSKAWYTLAKATGRGGQAVDELTTNLVQDSFNPLGDVQDGPAARTDARHKFTRQV